VQGDVLEAVEQAVEFGVITDRGGDAGAAMAALDDGVADQPCEQGPALAAQDDLVPVAGVAARDVDRASLRGTGSGR
jgi:hypothetical protein